MNAAARLARPALATIVTALVVLLAIVNIASVRTTGFYDLSLRPDAYVPLPPDATVRPTDLEDLTDRIHVLLQQTRLETNADAEPHRFHLVDGREVYPLVYRIRATQSGLLVLAELLFAAFGLFVLWWGRDRAAVWLGVACAALAPRLLPFFGDVTPVAMVVAQVASDALTFLAFYALYAMADSVARDALAAEDRVRRPLAVVHGIVAAVLVVGAGADLGGLLDAVAGGPPLPAVDRLAIASELVAWVAIFCILPPLLLGLAAVRATGERARKRAGVIFVATTLGLSGVGWSIASHLRQTPSFAFEPSFEESWFTLLLLPLAFIVAIRAYGVVEVRFILRRILIFTGLTLVVTAVIMGAEKFFDAMIEIVFSHESGSEGRAEGFAWEQAVVAFAIVVVLERVHGMLERSAERLAFRDRDRAVEELERFADEASRIALPVDELFERAADAVWRGVRADGSAVYAWDGASYDLAAARGARRWCEVLRRDDPALARERERIELETIAGSALGPAGLVFPMTVGAHRVGCLVVAARAGSGGGAYDAEECEALARVTRAVAAVAFARHADELAVVARAYLAGTVRARDLRSRAKTLAENPLVRDDA